MIKASEIVRRLEDTIESLRLENKKLRERGHKEPRLNYKWNINSFNDLPREWNEEWDFYTYKIYDKLLDERCVWKYVRYKSKWIDLDRVIESEADERDEIIDHQKWEIAKLKKEIDRCKKLNDTLINNARADDEKYKKLEKELWARLKQVEDLQSSYKTLQKENERLKSKLEQTVDEYDEDYKTFHRDDDKCFDENFRKIFWDFLWRDPF